MSRLKHRRSKHFKGMKNLRMLMRDVIKHIINNKKTITDH